MFLDEATITVTGGHGGRGCVSWRREKFIPKGGPDGGNGGKGGDIYIQANENTDTLSAYASKKKFDAKKGIFGMGKNKNGKSGDDLILSVPPGTQILDVDTKNVVADLQVHGEQILVATGGRGGYGNTHFVSSTRQRPDFAELGEPGQQRTLHLELKLVADVGIIGYPSVGKSTLISVMSSAKPKIADYPFTTLVPNLGVVDVDSRTYIVCDVPGLIEGASEGKGLGGQFLKHIERCGTLLHVLDIGRALGDGGNVDAEKLISDYNAIRKELEHYSPTLAEKKELVILNKTDLIPSGLDAIVSSLSTEGIHIYGSISAATTKGVVDLQKSLLPLVLEERDKRRQATATEELPVLKPHEETMRMGAYRIEEQPDGSVAVHGARLEQFTKMTDVSQDGALIRFRDVLERIGLAKALRAYSEGTKIFIGDIEVQSYL